MVVRLEDGLPVMICLQCPHQGAYHMTSLGRLVSSSTRDLARTLRKAGRSSTYLKLAAVRYLAGLDSQSPGIGSV